ncbi:Cuticle protein 16.8 like protein [Argiope bruennichi]|uniref:Cuticle protein 16.8 like protein n=2 Tax=Argiope bruennichi TaxID=94029 RepID=A0A8T0F9L4_ARGBR|nr:Cuticle protein 16.8 like protein [Argiope bruennichi]
MANVTFAEDSQVLMDCTAFLQLFLSLLLWKVTQAKGRDLYEAQETEYKPSYDAYASIKEEHHPPHPFHFGYDVLDEHGNKQQRQEQGDQHGNVKGSYGYVDAHGVYRQVDYVADHSGFRAVVQSNEPGVANEDPADVKLTAKAPPSHVLEQHLTKPDHSYPDPKLYIKASSKPVYKESLY